MIRLIEITKDFIAKSLHLSKFAWLPVITIFILVAFGGFTMGIFSAMGADAKEYLYELIPKVSEALGTTLFTLDVSIAFILLFLILIWPASKLAYLLWLRWLPQQVFLTRFDPSKPGYVWYQGYWQDYSQLQRKGIHNFTYHMGYLIIAAEPKDWPNEDYQSGVFYDVVTGIYEGQKYRVECTVRSDSSCTMGFQLWVHGTDVNTGESKKDPSNKFDIPPSVDKTYSVVWKANNSNALRIHLHCRAGTGRILVSEVKVTRSA